MVDLPKLSKAEMFLAEMFKNKHAEVQQELSDAQTKLTTLQEACPHYRSVSRLFNTTPNYVDRFKTYRIHDCMDCGKHWEIQE